MVAWACRLLAVASLVAVVGLVPTVVAALNAGPQQPGPRKVAFLVGVNKYDHRRLDDLAFAERDVTELGKVLTAQGFDVRLLLGSGTRAAQATRANVEAGITDALKGVTKADLVLVGLAGHGMQFQPVGKKVEEPFFCPVDAAPFDPSRLVSPNDILKKLDAAGAGTNLLLVDACRDDPDPDRGSRGIDGSRALAIPEGTGVLLACSRGQRARETAKANGGHGVFFHAVIDGLKGSAARNGRVTWDGLVGHVKDRVPDDLTAWFPDLPADRRQRPQAIGNTSGALVLATSAAVAIVGTWEIIKSAGDAPVGGVVEFTKDGKLTATFKMATEELKVFGTYKVENQTVVTTLTIGDLKTEDTDVIKKLTGTELVVEDKDGKTVEFKRLDPKR